MKGHFEFQEKQEHGDNFVKRIPTRIVPDEPEEVFATVEYVPISDTYADEQIEEMNQFLKDNPDWARHGRLGKA